MPTTLRLLHAAALAALAIVSTAALAQVAGVPPEFNFERLEVNSDANGSIVVGTGEMLPPGTVRFSLAGEYQNNPLMLLNVATGNPLGAIISDRYAAHVIGAFAPVDWMEIGVDLPVILNQIGSDLTSFGIGKPLPKGIGSPTASLRLGLFSQKKGAAADMALHVGVRAPVGTDGAWASDGRINLSPKLMMGRDMGFARAGIEVGMKWLPASGANPAGAGNQILLAGVLTAGDPKGLRGEVSGRTYMTFDGKLGAVEVLVGARYPVGLMEIYVVGGPGLGDREASPGTPAWRFITGVSFGNGLGVVGATGDVTNPTPTPIQNAATSQRLFNLKRAASYPWKDGGFCAVQEAAGEWATLVERCFDALDLSRIQFVDRQGICAVAQAGAIPAPDLVRVVGVCLLVAQPELVVGAVIIKGEVRVAPKIKAAIKAAQASPKGETEWCGAEDPTRPHMLGEPGTRLDGKKYCNGHVPGELVAVGDPSAVDGAIERIRQTIMAAEALLGDPEVSFEDRARLKQAIVDARATLARFQAVREQGGTRSMMATPLMVASAAIVADDATIVGAADDPLLILTGLALLATYISTQGPAGEEAVSRAWRELGTAIDVLAYAVSTIALAAKGEKLAGNIRQLAIHLARLLALTSVAGHPPGEPPGGDRDSSHWWKEIKAFLNNIGSAIKGASRKQVIRELLKRGFTEEQIAELESRLVEAARKMGEPPPPFLPP